MLAKVRTNATYPLLFDFGDRSVSLNLSMFKTFPLRLLLLFGVFFETMLSEFTLVMKCFFLSFCTFTYKLKKIPSIPILCSITNSIIVQYLTCVCFLGKRVKLFKSEWRSRERRFLLCLMTIFDFSTHTKYSGSTLEHQLHQSWSDSKEGPERSLRNKESNHSRKCVPALVYYSQSSRCVQIQVYTVLRGIVVPYSSLQLLSLLQMPRNHCLFGQDSRRVVVPLSSSTASVRCFWEPLNIFLHSLSFQIDEHVFLTLIGMRSMKREQCLIRKYLVHSARWCFIVESSVFHIGLLTIQKKMGKGISTISP